MSLIYAYKTKSGISVLSDTKATIESNHLSILKKLLTEEEYGYYLKLGVIKTIIYKCNITISSAGYLEHFNELLANLYEKSILDFKYIVNEALYIHNKYNHDTNFIITSENSIFEIKNGIAKEVLNSWIGDYEAFSKFQELRLNSKQPDIVFIDETSVEDKEDAYYDSTIYDSFEYIVKNRIFNTVGGFIVKCTLIDGKYIFLGSYGIFSGFDFKQKLLPNEGVVFSNNIEDGGFSYYVYDSDKYYTVYLEQVNKYILYKPGYSDKMYKFLSLPQIVDKNF